MSKTPEQLAVEWLKEEYGDTSNWTYMGQEMSLDAFYAGYQAAKPQWISVKDRLPETNELCIVSTEWRGIVPATYGNESWIVDEGLGWVEKALSYASHWMPLPKPPKDAKE